MAAETSSPVCAFVGLGAMGWHMAAHLLTQRRRKEGRGTSTLVHNRSAAVSERHASTFGTQACATLAELTAANVVCLCLPTSVEVLAVATQLADILAAGSLVLDATSGDPTVSRAVAELLLARGIAYVDAPVSGGPRGAEAGTLTTMLGGRDDDVARATRVAACWSKKITHVGGWGTGHATKAINNALNFTHLAVACEGLLALKALGVSPEKALSVINSSSGRSLQTEVRIPNRICTRTFDYGFKLSLMAKDVRIADNTLDRHFPAATFIRAARVFADAAVERLGPGADYTECVKELEMRIGGGVVLS